jgi:hypothetical protein
MNSQRYAYYSQKAADQFGTVFYKTPDGQLVEVTCVFRRGDEGTYNWPDKRYVGPVEEYVCQGRRGYDSDLWDRMEQRLADDAYSYWLQTCRRYRYE